MVSACIHAARSVPCGLAGQDFARVDTRRLDLVEGELKPPEGGLEHHTAIRVEPAKAAVETLAPVLHETQRDFRQFAAEPLVILDPGQRTVDSRRELTSSV